MNLSELEATNQKTLADIREGRADSGRPDLFPFYGFYEADIFECPSFVLFTANDCPRALNIVFDKNFEMMSMRLWCRLARNATGILDIGAHVGVYSLAAAALRKDITIHAFEPNPHAYSRLRMHKIINTFENIADHPCAVGDKNAYVPFSWTVKWVSQISSGGSVGERPGGKAETVATQQIKLDDTKIPSKLGARGLIKIDVEGGEVSVFEGMPDVLALKPDIILETFSQKSCDFINARILPLGYKVYKIFEDEKRIEPRDRLTPCVPSAEINFNQFLSILPESEVMALSR